MRTGSWLAGGVVALLLIGCSGEADRTPRMLGTAADCDAAIERCTVKGGGITLRLELGPEVKPLVSFPLALTIDGAETNPQGVVADFQMQGMDMGMNRYRLQSTPPSTIWRGTAMLPVCTASRMDWLAYIEFTIDGQPYQAVFPFHTETN